MLFNSLAFLVFFPLAALGYFLLPHKARWAWLLAASYFFYAWWRADFTALLLLSTAVGYFGGRALEAAPEGRRRGLILAAVLVFNAGLLLGFKYLGFFNESLRSLLALFGIGYGVPAFHIALPLGISFFTFRIMSYCIDVSRGQLKAERHPGLFALYVAFFPQLLSGPIERAGGLLAQFRERHDLDYGDVTEGLKRIAWGLFKKAVIADRLALVVNHVYGNPEQAHGIHLMAATVLYAFQLFCDFSAYSDMAVGTGRILGFRLTENFRQPYSALSLSDFWRRWHISLSTWFNDYLYTPMAIARRDWGIWAPVTALFATFLVSGLWHGAAWTFVVWGGLHGLGLGVEVLTKKSRKKLSKKVPANLYAVLAFAVTFGYVCFTYIFFRAAGMGDALYIATHLFKDLGADLSALLARDASALRFLVMGFGVVKAELIVALLSVGILEGVHWMHRRGWDLPALSLRPAWMRWGCYHALGLWILFFGIFGAKQFIYFQF